MIEAHTQKESLIKGEALNFTQMMHKYNDSLTSGHRADLRRVRLPEDLEMIPAYYRLLLPDVRPGRQWLRVVFMFPWAIHSDNADSLGMVLERARVSEVRLFQMIRANEPQDLLYLRRLCQQIKPIVDWQRFGRALYYWGSNAKRAIIEEFYMAEAKDSGKQDAKMTKGE